VVTGTVVCGGNADCSLDYRFDDGAWQHYPTDISAGPSGANFDASVPTPMDLTFVGTCTESGTQNTSSTNEATVTIVSCP